tara:strand:- start:256 stop:402 length:147 start_codon:yes stop_codon:yes gene_type:complete
MATVSQAVLTEKKIVKYSDSMTFAKKVGGQNGSEIAGTACDKYIHDRF